MELVTLRVLFPMVEVTLRSPGRRAELRGKHEIRRKKKKKKAVIGCLKEFMHQLRAPG